MIKLIALDLDGTLLTPEGEITAGAKAAIAAARKKGVRVVLNTGRAGAEAMYFAREAGCDHLLSGLGGACLADWEQGAVVHRTDIPWESGRKALELCLNREIELMIFAGNGVVLDPFSKESLLRGYPFPVFHDLAVVAEEPLTYMDQRGLPLTKLHGDRKPGQYPLRELAALPGIALTAASDHDFELVAAGVDKGKALAWIAKQYGIDLKDCAAVGDSDNDMAMLRVVGTPVAMGNASDAVKAACCHVAGTNREDGVAQAIWFCLQKDGVCAAWK